MVNEKEIKYIMATFTGGAKKQLNEEWTWGLALAAGLYQGLKYKGSIKAGITSGIVVLLAIAGTNGIYNVVSFSDKIHEASKSQEKQSL